MTGLKSFSHHRLIVEDTVGAALVEAAVIVFSLFLFISAIADYGLGLYRYSLLTYATSYTVRKAAADLVNAEYGKCSLLQAKYEADARRLLSESLLTPGSYEFKSDACTPSHPCGTGTQSSWPLMRMTGKWHVSCFFCLVANREFTVSTTSQAMIENLGFNCSD